MEVGSLFAGRMNILDQLWFKLRLARRTVGPGGDERVVPASDTSYTLFAVTAGSGRLRTSRGEQPFAEGTVYVLAPGEPIALAADERADLEAFSFCFDVLRDGEREKLPRVRKAEPLLPNLGVPLHIPSVSLYAMCNSVYVSAIGHDGLERFRSQFVFQELLHRLFNDLTAERNDELDTALEHLRIYVEQHYYEPLSIKRLAGISKISPRHLVRMFRDKYRVTPMEYIQMLRAKAEASRDGEEASRQAK